jgi:hypothetical protein
MLARCKEVCEFAKQQKQLYVTKKSAKRGSQCELG